MKTVNVVVKGVKWFFEPLGKAISGIADVVNAIAAPAETVKKGVEKIKDVFSSIKDSLNNVAKKVRDFTKDPIKVIKKAAGNVVTGFKKAIKDFFKYLVEKAKDFLNPFKSSSDKKSKNKNSKKSSDIFEIVDDDNDDNNWSDSSNSSDDNKTNGKVIVGESYTKPKKQVAYNANDVYTYFDSQKKSSDSSDSTETPAVTYQSAYSRYINRNKADNIASVTTDSEDTAIIKAIDSGTSKIVKAIKDKELNVKSENKVISAFKKAKDKLVDDDIINLKPFTS